MVRTGSVLALAAGVAALSLQVPVAARADAPRPAATCAGSLPEHMAEVGSATQLVTVVAPNAWSTTAVITSWQRAVGCWHVALGPWIGRVGVRGVRAHRREGDGATPLGFFYFYSTMYGNLPDPGVHYRYRRLRCGDWWDEDVRSPDYNSFQQVPCEATPPFANGVSEPLWLSPRSYSSFAVISYNVARVPGLGSGIFLHASLGLPTQGCVALARGLLDRLLAWLRPSAAPHIAIGTRATIDTL